MLVKLLAMIGNQLSILGDVQQGEECFSYYVAVVEVLFGENTIEAGSCYFWLSQFYFEEFLYEKAQFSLQKAMLIFQMKQQSMQERLMLAEIHFNMGQLMKKQMLFQKAMDHLMKAKDIFGDLIGKQCIKYTECLGELAKISFIMHKYENALALAK